MDIPDTFKSEEKTVLEQFKAYFDLNWGILRGKSRIKAYFEGIWVKFHIFGIFAQI